MFDKLKKAFSNIISDIGKKEITEKDLENTLFDLEIALLESDVAQEVIDDISKNLKSKLLGLSLEKDKTPEELIQSNVKNSIYEILSKSGTLDLVNEITSKKENKSGPFVVVFLGINGTGKTTTVAKVANLLHKNGLSVVLAASDTHRAGAIEQLGEHARRLSLKMIHQRYGADPSAVARDAVEYGKKHRVDAILIDTAGRMQTAKNLMDEISKIVQVVKPDLRIFIGDSLAGNDAINQAKEFFAYTKFDGAILTKTDADAKGGAIISIAYLTSKPIIYLGVGQNYDDIIPFNIDRFIESLFNSKTSGGGGITKKYDSTIIDENKNNEKLSTFESKSISRNDEATNNTLVEELQQQQQQQQKISSSSSSSSSNLDSITSDIEMSKVDIKKDDKTTNEIKDDIINLKNESLNSKLEKTDNMIEDVHTANKSFTSVPRTKDNSGVKSSVIEKADDNKNDKKKGFFSSFFGKRKSKENNDKVLSNYDQMSNSSNNNNNNKNDIPTANEDNKTKKNKNQEKNEIKYLSDDDLDELLKE